MSTEWSDNLVFNFPLLDCQQRYNRTPFFHQFRRMIVCYITVCLFEQLFIAVHQSSQCIIKTAGLSHSDLMSYYELNLP